MNPMTTPSRTQSRPKTMLIMAALLLVGVYSSISVAMAQTTHTNTTTQVTSVYSTNTVLTTITSPIITSTTTTETLNSTVGETQTVTQSTLTTITSTYNTVVGGTVTATSTADGDAGFDPDNSTAWERFGRNIGVRSSGCRHGEPRCSKASVDTAERSSLR